MVVKHQSAAKGRRHYATLNTCVRAYHFFVENNADIAFSSTNHRFHHLSPVPDNASALFFVHLVMSWGGKYVATAVKG